jgi:hypothetical protein
MASVGAPPTFLTQEQVNLLYEILQRFDVAAGSTPYSIACGTALGAVLRGGLIPWDLDADLFVRPADFEVIVGKLGGILRVKELGGTFKLLHPTAEFPSIDIYILQYHPITNVWSPRFPQRPNFYLDSDQVFFRDRVSFGPLRLPIFKNPERFLDRYYGPGWRSASSKEEAEGKIVLPAAVKDFRPALPTQTGLI